MAYEMGEIRTSQEIFYYLLENHELSQDREHVLYRAYAEQETIQNLVKSQAEAADSIIERYGNVIYLIPKEENNFLGFSQAALKSALCKSTASNRDYYLSQFVILVLLVEFYDGQGSTSKIRDYIRVGDLQNRITRRLRDGVQRAKEKEENGEEDHSGIAFENIMEAYEALKSDDKGKRARTTKEGFLHSILIFLQNQGLIDYVEQDEMIMTTKKLDNFMDWNLLNQNNYQRVLKVFAECSQQVRLKE